MTSENGESGASEVREYSANHYERAFENWLIDNRIDYEPADEHGRGPFPASMVKRFDFLVFRRKGPVLIAEVKGRRFHGRSLEKLAGLDCWVTRADVEGLGKWQEALGAGYEAVFIFAYEVERVDADPDGRELLEFAGRKYVFFCIRLDDYRSGMKRRSPKWRTVTLGADEFRRCAAPINRVLL